MTSHDGYTQIIITSPTNNIHTIPHHMIPNIPNKREADKSGIMVLGRSGGNVGNVGSKPPNSAELTNGVVMRRKEVVRKRMMEDRCN